MSRRKGEPSVHYVSPGDEAARALMRELIYPAPQETFALAEAAERLHVTSPSTTPRDLRRAIQHGELLAFSARGVRRVTAHALHMYRQWLATRDAEKRV